VRFRVPIPLSPAVYGIRMKTHFALVLSLSCAAFAEDAAPVKTRMAQLDKVEYADPFSGTRLSEQWKAAKGKWEVAGGVLRGSELPADNHGAVVRTPVKLQNMVVAFDVKLDGAKLASLSINAPKGHLARVRISPKNFSVNLDDPDKDGPEKGAVFFTKPVDIAPGTWHSVVLEIVGENIVGTLDDNLSGYGSHPSLAAKEKVAPGLTVAGESASFRNFRIYSAKPEPKSEWVKPVK
jgi:hypothetical protein